MFQRNINSQTKRIILATILSLSIFSLCKLSSAQAYNPGTNIEVCADNPAKDAPFANVDDPFHPILYYWVNNNGFYKYHIQIYRVSDGSLMHDTGEQWEIGPGIVAGSCTFDYPVPAGVLPVDNSQYKYMVRVLNTFGDWTPFAEGFFYLYSDGECGPSNAQTLCPSIMSAPSPEQLCKNPQPSPVTVSGGTSAIDPWTWICKSTVVGGKDSPQCQASVDEVSPGLAGTELSRTICPPDTINTNASALCSRFDSRFPPVVTGSGTTGDPWTWTCSDSCNDGSGKGTLYTRTISQAINATCGSANGKNYCAVNSEPDFNDLCAINGTSSNRVNGFNEWTWNCAGQCGGSSASCRAGNSRSCGWIETN